MNVQVLVLFEQPKEEHWKAMRSLAAGLTDDPDSVRVSAGARPGWLVVDFTMPTEAQYVAVPRIDRAIRWHADDRLDSAICFPRTKEEQARAERRNARQAERRRAKRRGQAEGSGEGQA